MSNSRPNRDELILMCRHEPEKAADVTTVEEMICIMEERYGQDHCR